MGIKYCQILESEYLLQGFPYFKLEWSVHIFNILIMENMKKLIITLLVFLTMGVAFFAWFNYYDRFTLGAMGKDIKIVFDYAKQEIPHLKTEIKSISQQNPNDKRLERLKKRLNVYQVAVLVADHDIEALKQMSLKELQFEDGNILVPRDKFSLEGWLRSETKGEQDQYGKELPFNFFIASQNALGFSLFASKLDKTTKDATKRYLMIKELLDKGLSPNAKADFGLWMEDIKGNPIGVSKYDKSLVYIAILFGTSNALALLLERGATFNKEKIKALIEQSKDEKRANIELFENIISKYSSQAR